ncbi:hypothetical protein [Tunturiibacter gelidoferens]|uniref:HTH HARE-type domain-containing protein n=1 Tax=Tunturiibacter lichenicola TaxID=2051959 RepID=A0A7Y9NPA3_9BACT|nr:hypothetical protein [Edaphobacter lichenicola]NYF53034.1 hypothetical protein [Edaphobacter lichenicola]
MGIRENFQKLVERKQNEIRELEMRIRESNAYIQALQDSIKLLPKEVEHSKAVDAEASLRPGTTLFAIQNLLRDKGGPMHVNDILSQLGKPIDASSRVSLVGTLGSYSRKGRVFNRPAPNTFGLIEFGDIEDQLEELPEKFGKMELDDNEDEMSPPE